MFVYLLTFLRKGSAADADLLFVREVRVTRTVCRSRRSEVLLGAGWGVIALKTWGTFWLVDHYAMPFNAWWIVAPTWVAAALCTWVYLRRN